MTSLRLPTRYIIYLLGSRSDVINCGVASCIWIWVVFLPRCAVHVAKSLGLIIPRGQSVSGRVVQAKWIDREGPGKRRTGTRQRSTYIHVHFLRNTNFDKIIISLLGWLASRWIIKVKVTDNDNKNCAKFTWYLNFHQNLRSPHHLTSVGKSLNLADKVAAPCAVLSVIAVWFLKLIPDQRPSSGCQ